ncbi:uncharacterized protein LOC125034612 [Penaeus chinensis]|uniref:uncharacterized protein LOC125034612 n=1 Tax=Penaeus chinensis TaxID=139456 RepID=UPI001FB7AF25|nr:uncharacterized protein LOC125034612 [Penaeus chinensis]
MRLSKITNIFESGILRKTCREPQRQHELFAITFMMDVWNKRQIPRPPECTLKYSAEEIREKNFDVCLQALLEAILCGHAALNHYEVVGCWKREAAILSTTLCQEIRHRKDKYFRVLKKVNKTAQRWDELKIDEYLSVLQSLTPKVPDWNK